MNDNLPAPDAPARAFERAGRSAAKAIAHDLPPSGDIEADTAARSARVRPLMDRLLAKGCSEHRVNVFIDAAYDELGRQLRRGRGPHLSKHRSR